MRVKAAKYIQTWRGRGYPDDIPDEVPDELMRLLLAPSYKAIAFAILQNDVSGKSLGFTPKQSPWYGAIKRAELAERARAALAVSAPEA